MMGKFHPDLVRSFVVVIFGARLHAKRYCYVAKIYVGRRKRGCFGLQLLSTLADRYLTSGCSHHGNKSTLNAHVHTLMQVPPQHEPGKDHVFKRKQQFSGVLKWKLATVITMSVLRIKIGSPVWITTTPYYHGENPCKTPWGSGSHAPLTYTHLVPAIDVEKLSSSAETGLLQVRLAVIYIRHKQRSRISLRFTYRNIRLHSMEANNRLERTVICF